MAKTKLEELVVELTVENKSLVTQLKASQSEMDSAMKSMAKSIDGFATSGSASAQDFSSIWETAIGVGIGEIGVAALEKVAKAFEFMIEKIGEGIAAAAAEELALARLNNTLKMTGQFTEEGAASLRDFADEKEAQLGLDNTLIANNLALLATITKLSNEGLKKAQQAAIDLSAALGKDLNEATMLVARGVEGNFTAFERLGISIDAGQTKAENLDNILKALAHTSGAAEAQTLTYEGSTRLLTSAQDNLWKSLGKFVTENPLVIKAMGETTKSLSGLTKEIDDNRSSWLETFNDAVIGLAIKKLDKYDAMVSAAIGATAGLSIPLVGAGEAAVNFADQLQHAVVGGREASTTFEWTAAVVERLERLGQGETFFTGTRQKLESLRKELIDTKYPLQDLFNVASSLGSAKPLDFVTGIPSTIKAPKVVKSGTDDEITKEALARDKKLAEDRLAAEQAYSAERYAVDLEQFKIAHDEKVITDDEYYDAQNSLLLDRQDQELAQLQEHLALKGASEAESAKEILLLTDKQYNDQRKLALDQAKFEQKQNQLKLEASATFLGGMSALALTFGRDGFELSKRLSEGQAIVAGIAAVQNALRDVPYPYNLIAAAGVGAMTAANVVQIERQQFNKGGTVPGIGFQDTVDSSLTPGEEVVDRSTSKKLRQFLNGSSGSGTGELTFNHTFDFKNFDDFIDVVESKLLARERVGTSLRAA